MAVLAFTHVHIWIRNSAERSERGAGEPDSHMEPASQENKIKVRNEHFPQLLKKRTATRTQRNL